MANAPDWRYGAEILFDPSASLLLRCGGQGPVRHRVEFRQAPAPDVTYREFFEGQKILSGLAVSADGQSVLLAQADRRQVRSDTGALLQSWPRPAPADIRSVIPDGRIAVLTERSHSNVDSDVVLDTTTGQERYRHLGGDRICLSGDGKTLIEREYRVLYGRLWNSRNSQYDLQWRFVSDPDEWFGIACISTDGSLVAAVGGRPGNSQGEGGLSVHLLDGSSGQLLARYHRDDDRRIERPEGIAEVMPNADGSLVAITTWGRDRRHLESFVLSPQSGSPVWELPTPGSGRTVDLMGSRVIVGTKGVDANVGSGRGEVYASDLGPRMANVPQNLTRSSATPWRASPGAAVLLSADLTDGDGIASVVAQIESPRNCVVARVPLADDGRHGDGGTQDGRWGAWWLTELRSAEYFVNIVATDSKGNAGTNENVANFTTRDTAWITMERVLSEQQSFKVGRNAFGLRLQNQGTRVGRGLRVRVSSNDPAVTPEADGELNTPVIDTLPPNQSVDLPVSSFVLQLDATAAMRDFIPITVLTTDEDGHRWVESTQLMQTRSRRMKTKRRASFQKMSPSEPLSKTMRHSSLTATDNHSPSKKRDVVYCVESAFRRNFLTPEPTDKTLPVRSSATGKCR